VSISFIVNLYFELENSEYIENNVRGNITSRGVSNFNGAQSVMENCVKCGKHFLMFVREIRTL